MPPQRLPTSERTRTGPLGRWLLGAIVLGYVALAVNASVLIPMWEIPDEHPHLQTAVHWAREGSMPDRTNLPGRVLYPGLLEPLAYWINAGALIALGIDDVDFLRRPRADLAGDLPQMYLHGADEVFPFAGPIRQLHLMRLLSVLFGAATVIGAHRLGRRIAPDRPAVALLGAGLVASLPAFAVVSVGITVDSLSIALATWSMVALCALATDATPGRRRTIGLGLLIGASLLTKLTTLFLLALVPVALLLRRPRGESWRASLRHFDWVVAGTLLVVGPYLAWNLVTYGDIFALDWYRDYLGKSDDDVNLTLWQAIRLHFLPTLGTTYVGRYTMLLDAGRQVMLAWTVVGLGGVVGWILLAVRRRTRLPGVVWLPLGAVIINLIMCLRVFAGFYEIHGRYMYPSLAALACLVALGWLAWAWRPLALAGVVALFSISVSSQLREMGPAYWPTWRATDPFFMSWDPLVDVPVTRRLMTVTISGPAPQSEHVDAPTLRWVPPADPEARFTVHLGTRGSKLQVRSYEDFGLALRDAYRIPQAAWRRVPPGVGLVCRVIRLPTLQEVLDAPEQGLVVDVSKELILRRVAPTARP